MGIQVYSEEQILVNVPKTKGKTGSLWVSVNGVNIEIPRGMDVLVDRKYAEVIERCLKVEELEAMTSDEIKTKERERIGAASTNNPVFTGSLSMGRKSDADIGENSTALGENNTASGKASFAEGMENTASGESVHIEGIGNKQFKNVLDTVNRTEDIAFETSGSMSYGSWRLLDSPISAYDGTILRHRCDKRYLFRGEIINHELYSSGATIHAIINDAEIYAVVDNNPRYSYLYATDIPEKWYSLRTADILHIYNEEGTISNYTHIQGRYNAQTDKNMAHIVGNGTDDQNRSNAHTLDWEGNAEFQGDVTAQGCGGETPVSLVATEKRVKKLEEVKPLVLYADDASAYTSDAAMGDKALEAILAGRQILVRVPNADGGATTAIYSPVLMYQLPNQSNNYLYLFYLRDEKQDLSEVLGVDIKMPIYGELKLLLSETYNETPLI